MKKSEMKRAPDISQRDAGAFARLIVASANLDQKIGSEKPDQKNRIRNWIRNWIGKSKKIGFWA
ncbi:MAG: hypothetical protein LBK98_10790 [Peptococcaceae bacterium]|jgi:hypothetical protein|nr:hypothetical protein [Peptococcaceae bacterium]